jgi:hypothetical protein
VVILQGAVEGRAAAEMVVAIRAAGRRVEKCMMVVVKLGDF